MRIPYLRRKNTGWQMQIRLPVTLDPCLRLSPARVTPGPMPAIEARRKAVSVVAAVQAAIAQVEHAMQNESLQPKAARDAVMDKVTLLVPTLIGLDALGLSYGHREQVADRRGFRCLAKEVGAEFIAIVGDCPIGAYRRADLQQYANEIFWLSPTASSAKGYRHENVRTCIQRNKKSQGGARSSLGEPAARSAWRKPASQPARSGRAAQSVR